MPRKSNATKPPSPPPVMDETRQFLACDLGNGYTNIRADDGIAEDFRSIMAPLPTANRLKDPPIGDVINFEGQWWVAGERCYTLAPNDIEDNITLNRYTSPFYRRLFAFALHKAFRHHVGRNIVYPHVISSIPANLFKIPGQAERVKNHLKGDYEISNVHGGTVMISVNNLNIIPEGIGTYFGYIFGAGNNDRFAQGTWMYADFGYLTLDAVFVKNGDYMPDMAKSDSQTGMSKVADQLRDMVIAETGVELDRSQIDEAMECDAIPVNGRQVNISRMREDALAQIGGRATSLLEQWARNINLDGVVLTGGGAKYMVRHINSKILPLPITSRSPRRDNVEGAYLYITAE